MMHVTPSMGEKLESLSSEQAELLKLLLEAQARSTQAIQPNVRDVEGSPLSWEEQRLWFIDRLEGGSAGYNIPIGVRLTGFLNTQALQQALDTIVTRHEVLRTAFVTVEGEPKRKSTIGARFALTTFDLSQYEAGEREVQARLHEREEAREPFDLSIGPLIRGRLLHMATDEHVLLLTIHHIVSDGWSMSVFIRELAALYSAYCEGRENPLQPLPIQYADYAHWQRAQPPEQFEGQLSYWRKQLESAPPQLELPTDRARPPVQSYRGSNVDVELDAELTASLRAFAFRHGMTLFMVLYAGWAILLSRLSGQDDIVIGTPVANRQRPELEGLLGLFVNTLVLRVQVDGTLEEYLERVKEVTLTAYEHQEMPFGKLVEALQPQRSLGRNPIFQVAFALQNTPKAHLHLPGLTQRLEEGVTEPAIFDLLLSLEERAGQVTGYANYAADLFDRATVTRWMACLKVLLKDLATGMRARVKDLSILPREECRRVLEDFNAGQTSYPQQKLISELFQEQVERTPGAIAVEYEDRALTYVELNTRANQLAHYLTARGLGTDRLVGICVERSLEMVVGLLGILKAGGAYVPLDPAYPMDRLAYMLADAAPKLVLTQRALTSRLPGTSAEVIELDNEWERIAAQSEENLDARSLGACPDDLAYVIYTSGSTGDPKGCMVEHRNVTRLFAATEQHFGFNERDVWTLFHSFAFDFSVWELWGALLYGGRVVVVPYLTARSPQEFYRLVCEKGVTVLNQTPSAFAQFADAQAQSPDRQHSLRVVIFGGEALEFHTLRPWVKRNGATTPQLVNMYGITETTVHVTYRLLSEQEIESERGSLIGRPIRDLRTYILDEQRQPVPIGVTGEIYVGGAGVARGYLKRAELTAQRFMNDPFSPEPLSRMYRSGDLGRWRADGTIEYLGRNDTQVKLRGFRIELGEIEAQLAQNEHVKEAVVIAREDVPGEKRLVAYVVPNSATELSVEVLRSGLKSKLPEHMVPSAFVTLERVPLTSNGKLDRRALPVPELGAYVSRAYEPPQGEVEEILAGIWQALLGVERVGRQDNFFELGGHSLLIVRMLERLRRIGWVAEVRRVFSSPTLAELAAAVTLANTEPFNVPPNRIPPECAHITPDMLPLVELEPEHIEWIAGEVPGGMQNIQDIYPLAPLQEGILFHHLLDKQGGDTYLVGILLSIVSRETLDDLIASLQAVINRHDALRTAVLWERLPRPIQVVYRRAALQVDEVTLDPGRDPLQQTRQWLDSNEQRLALTRAPLVRLQTVRDATTGQWYALLQLHHIVCDHVTTETVISELVAHLEERVHTLPKPAPYRNHVAQALAYTRAHDPEAFFRSKLADVEEPTTPFGLLSVHGDGERIEEARQSLDIELAQCIRAQARRMMVSAATLFHAAWALVVAHTSGRDDVVFGSVLLGRLLGSSGVERVLGMFINTLPLRLRLQSTTAMELVEQTQRELIELLSHEQASLAIAQRCSGIVGSTPLFNVLLNYRHSNPNLETDWEKLDGIRPVAYHDRTNYPITVSVDDLGEGFTLVAQTDRRIDPHRITGYLATGIVSLIEALEQAPQTPALSISILPRIEREHLIKGLNTAATYPSEKRVHELFEAQVQHTPAEQAVLYEGQSLTYAELDTRATRLAHYLRARGVSTDQVVGICVERSLEMIVGLLAILKAGGAYMPLDPAYPSERLAYMLKDAAPGLLLSQRRLQSVLPETTAEVVWLDEKLPTLIDCDTPLEDSGNSESLVYVIYTSGSTGQPKGTAMPHRPVVNLIEWQRRQIPSRAGQRALQFAALSFDVAFQEIFSTLCTGATLVLLPEQIRRDVRELAGFLRQHSIERLFLPPLMLQALAEYLQAVDWLPESLRDVITAGEQLRITPEIASLFERLRCCQLHNHYGPTETHVVTALTLTGVPSSWPILPSIGRPISNAKIFVLDARRQLAPLGVPGEIYIGGDSVARGYLGRPDLTDQRFVADPFRSDTQARLYKTGDLGCWQADGTLSYLGRNDDQVKIRGYRIELGEIEAQLMRHEQVRDAAVVLREDAPGQKRLVAYLTAGDVGDPDVEELRTYLRDLLPEHMIPTAFVVLEAFPLTPSGKLNRRALPPPDLGTDSAAQYEPPQGEVEKIVAGVWRDLLRVERVGRGDNFFDLGGHSLLAMQMTVRLLASLSIEVPISILFRFPTLQQFAAQVDDLRQASLLRDIEAGEHDMGELLEKVAAMSESQVQELLGELTRETP